MSDACMRTSDALRLVAEKIECIKPKQIKDIAWCIATLENAASQMDSISDEIYELRQQLTASQRRADAAVEDMKLIVDAVREEHCDETCCFACAFDCDTSINDSGVPNCECPGFERDDCFEWRGVKEENKCAQS